MPKNESAVALGKLGGAAHRKKSPEERSRIAALGGAASWAGISPEERSKIMKERAAKRKSTKEKKS